MEKPIPVADIDFVIDLTQKLGVDEARVAGFKQLSSVSFSPISALALSYSQPGSLGGQGVGYLRDATVQILTDHAGQISSDEARRLNGIRGTIDAIRSCDPVIYAVDLKGLARIDYQTVTAAVHSCLPGHSTGTDQGQVARFKSGQLHADRR